MYIWDVLAIVGNSQGTSDIFFVRNHKYISLLIPIRGVSVLLHLMGVQNILVVVLIVGGYKPLLVSILPLYENRGKGGRSLGVT